MLLDGYIKYDSLWKGHYLPKDSQSTGEDPAGLLANPQWKIESLSTILHGCCCGCGVEMATSPFEIDRYSKEIVILTSAAVFVLLLSIIQRQWTKSYVRFISDKPSSTMEFNNCFHSPAKKEAATELGTDCPRRTWIETQTFLQRCL